MFIFLVSSLSISLFFFFGREGLITFHCICNSPILRLANMVSFGPLHIAFSFSFKTSLIEGDM